MKGKIPILFSLLFYTINIFGQDNLITETSKYKTYKTMTYSIGYSHFRIQDIQVSPFVYKSNNIPIGIGYANHKDKGIFSLDFFLSYGSIKNKTFSDRTFSKSETNNEGEQIAETYEMGNFPIIQEGIRVTYLQKTNLVKNNKYNLYFGTGINQYFLLSFTTVPIFVVSEITLNPTAYLTYNLNEKSAISSSLSFPIAGIMSRLPYSNDPADGKHGELIGVYTTGSKFSQPANYQKVNFSMEYIRQLSERWQVSFDYGFQWLHYSANRGVKAYNNQFSIHFIKKFKTK